MSAETATFVREHGGQTPDAPLIRVACAALDEAADYLARRVGTYDEQPDEDAALRRVQDASHDLKLRLAGHVLGSVSTEASA